MSDINVTINNGDLLKAKLNDTNSVNVQVSSDDNLDITVEESNIDISMDSGEQFSLTLENYTQGGGGGGTDDYELLIHKPQINSVTLIGNKKGKQLYLLDAEDTISESEIDRILYGGLGE